MEIDLQLSKKIFNPVYYKYLSDFRRTQIFYGGSSSGKSYFLAQRVVIHLLQGRNYLICRNTGNTIKKSVFNEIIKAIHFFKLGEYFKINKSDLMITCLLNNKQVLFAGLDDVEKVKSITPIDGVIDTIWVEEATECEYDAIKQLYKRLRGQSDHKKMLILSFNPILKTHWIYTEYFREWEDNMQEYFNDDLCILKTTYKDNKFLTEDDIKGMESESDPYFYNVYTLGNWGILGSVIFKNWEVQDLRKDKKEFDNFYNGVDFGYSTDPAACIRTHYDKKRKIIYVVGEIYETELTNPEFASRIIKLIGNEEVLCDSAEPKSIKELRDEGVRSRKCKKGKDSILYGIQWLQQHQIVVDTRCTHFKNEIQQYKWKEDKSGNALSKPEDRNNHLIDALRYAYSEIMIKKQWGFGKPK